MNCSKLKTQMITKSTGYESSDGKFHRAIEDAQKHELTILFDRTVSVAATVGMEDKPQTYYSDEVASEILKNSTKIIDILTMKPNSLPKARKINGGTKKRTKHIAAQNTLPLDTTEPPRAA